MQSKRRPGTCLSTRPIAIVLLALALTSAGCTDEDEGAAPIELPEQYWFGGDRAAELHIPDTYDHVTPTPLLVVLHGYSASGLLQLAYTGLRDLTDLGYLVIAPDGTFDADGNPFWNATDACCDFYDTGVDDAAYLSNLIDEIRSVYRVDDRRIYLFGHSNGGFMSYRMACERADTIAGIISLAGSTFLDPDACAPTQPVSVLQIHGEDDDVILYAGSEFYPSAEVAMQIWAGYDGCTGNLLDMGERRDIEGDLDGLETRVAHYEGCPSGIDVELWSIEAGAHLPVPTSDFAEQLAGWLSAHAKPE